MEDTHGRYIQRMHGQDNPSQQEEYIFIEEGSGQRVSMLCPKQLYNIVPNGIEELLLLFVTTLLVMGGRIGIKAPRIIKVCAFVPCPMALKRRASDTAVELTGSGVWDTP